MSEKNAGSNGPRLEVTTTRTMLLTFGLGALLGWLVISGVQMASATVPVPPWTLVWLLALLGLVGVVWSRALRARVRRNPKLVSPEEGLLAVTTGKTMVITGLLLAGGHVVLALSFLNRIDAPLPRERVIHGALTALAGLATAVGGWLLERACVTQPPREDHLSSVEDHNNT